jgi:hypothetical protein
VDQLADEIQKQGGAAPAKTLWNALVAQAGDYASKNGVAAKLQR